MIHVVAGVLIDGGGRVLIAQRPPGKPLAGGWEFPGGKLEPGEDRVVGLARELKEELSVDIGPIPRPLLRLIHTYDHGSVLLDIFVVREYAGEPRGIDGQALRWCSRAELELAALLPADGPVVRALRLPERIEHERGEGFRVVPVADMVNGLTLPGDVMLGASCSDADEAVRATHARADFVSMRSRLGVTDLVALCRAVPIPVFAHGIDLNSAWRMGASGINALPPDSSK